MDSTPTVRDVGAGVDPGTGTDACPDLLVLGDVHLHGRSRECDPEAITAFIRSHTDGPERTERRRRPLRLILSGDFFDFTLADESPGERAPHDGSIPVSRRERRFGLDPTGPGTVWKIRYLATRFPHVFEAMGAFVAAGNEIVFVSGNHDAELHWPEARQALREAVAEAAPRGAGPDVAKGVRFRRWFYHEPGLVHVQHGHQYDPDNVFSDPLSPVDQRGGREIQPSLGRHVSRFLLSKLVGVYDSHQDNERTPWPIFVSVVRNLGCRAPWIILSYYIMAVRALLIGPRGAEVVSSEAGGGLPTHSSGAAGQGEDVEELKLSGETLRRLRALQPGSTMESRQSISERLYLVRSISFALVVLGLTALAFGLVPLDFTGVAPLVLVVAALCGSLRKGNRYRDRAASSCETAAAGIASILDVPYLVMSHTHNPVIRTLEEGGTYANTGSFSENGMDRSGGYPYVELRRDGTGLDVKVGRYFRDEGGAASDPDRTAVPAA